MERMEKTLAIIELYREKEELWNMRSPTYKSLDARKSAYQEIAAEMGMGINEIKKKIKSIRTVYVAEKSKVESNKRQGTVYEPSLAWYKRMAFLDCCIVPRKVEEFEEANNECNRKQTNGSTVVIDLDMTEEESEKLAVPQSDRNKHNINMNELLEGESYKTRCGEVYLTTLGRVMFHCALCEMKFGGYDSYELHLDEHKPKEEQEEDELFNDDNGEILGMSPDKRHISSNNDALDEYESYSISLIKSEDESITDDEEDISYSIEPDSEPIIEDNSEPVFGDSEKIIVDNSDELSTHINDEDDHFEEIVAEIPPKKRFRRKNTTAEPILDDGSVLVEVVREVEKRSFPRSKLTPDEQRKFKCPACGLGFKERHNMIHHLKRHSDKKDYKCTNCGKAFYTPSELRIHNRTHTKERAFLCNICGRSYVYSTQLADHLKRHQNIKPHKCEVCNKRFYDKSDLAEHMVGHSSARNYSCELCPATFSRHGALRNHQKLHENKREYKCQLCSASFNQRAGLYSHMKTIHKAV